MRYCKEVVRASVARCVLCVAVVCAAYCIGNACGEESTTSGHVTVVLPLRGFGIEKGEAGSAAFDGEIVGQPGAPGLPSRVFRILLPADAKLDSVGASMVDSKISELPGKWDVLPYSPVATVGGHVVWPEGAKIVEGRDMTIYSRDSAVPESSIGLVKPFPLGRWRIAEVRIYPYRYNPMAKQLVRLTKGSLRIDFGREKPAGKPGDRPSRRSARQRSRVSKMVLNFREGAETYDRKK